MQQDMLVVDTDMCAHGLREPEWNMPIKKPTRLVTTSAKVAVKLQKRCSGDHDHRTIEGTWKHDGKTVKASEFSAGYTKTFVTSVVKAFEAQLDEDLLECYTAFGLENSVEAQRRRAVQQRLPFDEAKARRRALEDDVQDSLRKDFERRRRAWLQNDVPQSIRANLQKKRETREEQPKTEEKS